MKIGLLKTEFRGQKERVVYSEELDLVYYDDITSILVWHAQGTRKYDYHYVREQIKTLVTETGFNNLNDKDKEYALLYCSCDANEQTAMSIQVGYYMGLGMTLEEASAKYLILRADDINNAAKACQARLDDKTLIYIALKHMTQSNATAFLDSIRNFLTDLARVAHMGTNYGQTEDGILDYIECTGSYTETGLNSFFTDTTLYEACRDEFKNYFYYGIKPTEFGVSN